MPINLQTMCTQFIVRSVRMNGKINDKIYHSMQWVAYKPES